jgi:3-carboxy-cis,cis-muconate cycloisomerase
LTFDAIFVPDALAEATDDGAFLQAMLDAEAALARAQARAGVIPAEAAEKVAEVCRADRYDLDELARPAIRFQRSSRPPIRNGSTTVRRARTSSTPRRCSSPDALSP